MKTSVFLIALFVLTTLASSRAFAQLKIQTFETAPQYEEEDFNPPNDPPSEVLNPGAWATREGENASQDPPVPVWQNIPGAGSGGSDGYLQPIGTETPLNNRGTLVTNYEDLPSGSVLANVFPGINVLDNDSWGDVSTATYVTMDVKGSFASSGGITVLVSGDGGFFWSWGAAASSLAVGANPGDVTEWTTLLIPINRPTKRDTGHIFPSPDGSEGHVDGFVSGVTSGLLEDGGAGGNWGTWQDFADDQELSDVWDSVFSSVDSINVRGLTPDTQIDNLGFVLPDVGIAGDFDLDDDVDGADFLLWQRDMSIGNLAEWEANFGTVAAVGAAAAVPEPSAIVLALLAGCGLLGGRRKC